MGVMTMSRAEKPHELGLEEKVELSLERCAKLVRDYGPDDIAVAWTGGKDSTVVLALWRRVLEQAGLRPGAGPRALNLDTGCKFPETLAFRDRLAAQWSVALSVYRPQVDLDRFPVAQDPVQCCSFLKIEPLKRGVREMGLKVLLTGLRSDEHLERQSREWLEARSDPAYQQAHPILHWTEMDVWAYHLSTGLEHCPLYDQGYRSLGCVPCTRPMDTSEREGRNRDKESRMGLLRSLGYF
jgi:phosphoadenosine phosphosulfate reductase